MTPFSEPFRTDMIAAFTKGTTIWAVAADRTYIKGDNVEFFAKRIDPGAFEAKHEGCDFGPAFDRVHAAFKQGFDALERRMVEENVRCSDDLPEFAE